MTGFPDLTLSTWRESRDLAHGYARVLGQLRRSLTPPQRHWWHVSLRVTPSGLTTTPIPGDEGTFEVSLDWLRQRAEVHSSRFETASLPLSGQSEREFLDWLVERIHPWGIEPEIDRSDFSDQGGDFLDSALVNYHNAVVQIDQAMKAFSGSLGQYTSPVQLFPHHFDLAVSWFSGQLVPGEDPDAEESSREQMTFGFSTGDTSISDAYFYATTYPPLEELSATEMPSGAYWNRVGFQGAVLPYAALVRDQAVGAQAGRAKLDGFLRTLQAAGSQMMLGEPSK